MGLVKWGMCWGGLGSGFYSLFAHTEERVGDSRLRILSFVDDIVVKGWEVEWV